MLRVRDLGRVRAGAQRHPAGAGLLLPHAVAERSDLAHRGHAVGAALRVPVPAADAGHLLAALHPHARLAPERPRGVHGLRLHPHLDRALPRRHHHDPPVQAGIGFLARSNRSLNSCKVTVPTIRGSCMSRGTLFFSKMFCSSLEFEMQLPLPDVDYSRSQFLISAIKGRKNYLH